ncbi:hypothetical protein ACFE04_001654 [Oxalis oulophora]
MVCSSSSSSSCSYLMWNSKRCDLWLQLYLHPTTNGSTEILNKLKINSSSLSAGPKVTEEVNFQIEKEYFKELAISVGKISFDSFHRSFLRSAALTVSKQLNRTGTFPETGKSPLALSPVFWGYRFLSVSNIGTSLILLYYSRSIATTCPSNREPETYNKYLKMDMHFSDSDWENYSESGSSSEGQEEIELLYGGQALNILSSLEESILKIDDFLSFERGFMHGDAVCSVTDPSGQMGKVTNINLFVDLENVFGKVVKNVNSKNLSKIRTISVGDNVVYGTWLGRVDKIVDSISVIFDDGSKNEFIATDQEKLIPVSPNLLEDSPYIYYPGQRIRIKQPNASKSAGWLCGSSRDNFDEGTVCAVEAGFLYVDWLASVLSCSDPLLRAPARFQNAKNLTLLSCFSHSNWQIGDWCMLSNAEQMDQNCNRRNKSSSLEAIFVISKTKAKVDVVWQDDSYSLGLDSQTLQPVSVVNAHDFLPEQFVLEKSDPQFVKSNRWGVVLGMDAKEQTVKVRWNSMKVKEHTSYDEEKSEEIVSAYELVEHPDFSYCYGDVVFRSLHKLDYQSDNDQLTTKVESQNICYLSYIGIITGLKDGLLEVKWATGLTTKVSPYEIYRVDKFEGSASNSVPYEEIVENLNEEIIEQGKQLSSMTGKDSLNFNDAGENQNERSESSSFSLSQAAIGFFSSIASSLFGFSSSTTLPRAVTYSRAPQDGTESEDLPKSQTLETSDLLGKPYQDEYPETGKAEVDQEVKQNEENETFTSSMTNENSDHFRQFDLVQDCSDHHLLDANNKSAQTQVKKGWLKKVQQEWSILEKNLPESIYVRAYEERIDLLRAVIVGAPGTPYHDGLFFFDIFLPTEYPNEPPHFEALVEEHFARRSQSIMLACKAYLEGVPVGCTFDCEEIKLGNSKSNSTGFKIMLEKLFPMLLEAFTNKGIDCSQFVQPNK